MGDRFAKQYGCGIAGTRKEAKTLTYVAIAGCLSGISINTTADIAKSKAI